MVCFLGARSTAVRAAAAITLAAAASACSSGGASADGDTDGSTDGGTSPPGQMCRQALSEANVSFDAMSATMTCTFDSSSLTLTCEVPFGSDIFRVGRTYASLSDFISEGDVMGKNLATSEFTDEPGTSRKTTTYTYDAERRLTLSVEERAEGTITTTYADHDDDGRPRQGDRSWFDCESLPMAISYDDVARTVTTSFQPSQGTNCSFDERDDTDTYDEHGNRIKVEEGGTSPRVVFEATVTQTTNVCE